MKVDFQNTLVESIGMDAYGRVMGIRLHPSVEAEPFAAQLNEKLKKHGIFAMTGDPNSVHAGHCDMRDAPEDSLVLVTLRGDDATPQRVLNALQEMSVTPPRGALMQVIDCKQLGELANECTRAVARRR